jgi:hypothetical protein
MSIMATRRAPAGHAARRPGLRLWAAAANGCGRACLSCLATDLWLARPGVRFTRIVYGIAAMPCLARSTARSTNHRVIGIV